MTHEQALEVLKKYASAYQLLFPASKQKYDQALTIAIEIMEGSKDAIMKAWMDGHNRLLPFKQDELREHAEQYYNSLTKTPQT